MRTLRAEWTKVCTLPGNLWAVLGMLALTVGTGAAVCARAAAAEYPTDTTVTALSGVYVGQNAVVVFAVLAVTNEYATRMIQTSVAATPRRYRLLAARMVVVAGTVLVAGAIGVLGSLLAGARLLELSAGDGPTLRAGLGTVAYLVLLALASAGAGLALRDTGAATAVVLGALYLLPIIASQLPDPDVREDVQRFAPMVAGLAVQATRDLDRLPIQPGPGLALFGGYAAAALLAGAISFVVRDV